MALTAEQENQLEFQIRTQEIQSKDSMLHKRAELIRLAKEVLFENDKSKDIADRGVTTEEILEMASALEAYITK